MTDEIRCDTAKIEPPKVATVSYSRTGLRNSGPTRGESPFGGSDQGQRFLLQRRRQIAFADGLSKSGILSHLADVRNVEDQSLECTSDRVVDDPLGVLFVDALLKTIRSLID